MNVEDMIRAANPVRSGDLPDGDSPRARAALAAIQRERDAPAGPGHHGHSRWWLPALAVMAAGAAVAVVVSLVQGAPPGKPPAATAPRLSSAPAPRASRAQSQATARQILLLAADHVAAAPVSGKYWRIKLIGGTTFPGGTKADPYDITVRASADQWNPSTPGQREWVISRQLGARPATPADAAAWRAAGSPATWRSGLPAARNGGWLAGYPLPWVGSLAASTTAAPPTASGQVSDGTVGFVEGDLPGLKAAQFAAMPATTRGIATVLRRYYRKLKFCARHPANCSTQDQIIWSEAVMLLGDPISAQARAATLRVMAALPGVRLLGLVTDPLGRTGYALAGGQEYPNPDPAHFNPLNVIIIDPRTGSVLATEELGPMPRTLHCLSFDDKRHCSGPAYYGRSHVGQVDSYVAVVSEGWTNAAPALPPPSRRTAPTGSPGLPPLLP